MACRNLVKISDTFHEVNGWSFRKPFGGQGKGNCVLPQVLGIGAIFLSPIEFYDYDANLTFKGVITRPTWATVARITELRLAVQDWTYYLLCHSFTDTFGGLLSDAAASGITQSGFPGGLAIHPALEFVEVEEFFFEGGFEAFVTQLAAAAQARWNVSHITGNLEFYPADISALDPDYTHTLPQSPCDLAEGFGANGELASDWTSVITRQSVAGYNSDLIKRRNAGASLTLLRRFNIIAASENRFFGLHPRTTIVQQVEMRGVTPADEPYYTAVPDPATVTIVGDGCITLDVIVTPFNGFTGAVKLNEVPISGLPTGVTYTFTPDEVTLGSAQTAVLELCTDEPIDCSGGCVPGTYSHATVDIEYAEAFPSTDCCELRNLAYVANWTWTAHFIDTCGNEMGSATGSGTFTWGDPGCTYVTEGPTTYIDPNDVEQPVDFGSVCIVP